MKMYKEKFDKPMYCKLEVNYKYDFITLLKNKPIIKTSEFRLYKIIQKTIVELDKQNLIDIYNVSGNSWEGSSWSDVKKYYEISKYGTIKVLQDILKNKNIYTIDNNDYQSYAVLRTTDKSFDELEDDITVKFVMFNFNEDAELIIKRTNKEQEYLTKEEELKNHKRIYDTFIKTTVDNVLNEFGIKQYGDGFRFKDYNAVRNFIYIMLKDNLSKRLKEIGIDFQLNENPFDKLKHKQFDLYDSLFTIHNLKILNEKGGTNNE